MLCKVVKDGEVVGGKENEGKVVEGEVKKGGENRGKSLMIS